MQYKPSSLEAQPLVQTLSERIAPVPPYAALIFDCDGMIADTLAVHFQIWTAAFQTFGAALPEAWYYERTGLSAGELIQAFNQSFNYALNE